MDSVIYRSATPGDEAQVRKLYNTFWRDEILSTAIGMEVPKDCQKFVEYSVKECLQNEVSVVAEDTVTGEVIGFNMCVVATPDDRKLWSYPDDDPNCKKMIKQYKVIESMSITDDWFSFYQVKSIIFSRGITVYERYRQKGIGLQMMAKSLEIARQIGVQLVIMDCTSLYSKRIMEKLEFVKVNEIKLSDIKDEGLNIKEENPHNLAALYVLKLL